MINLETNTRHEGYTVTRIIPGAIFLTKGGDEYLAQWSSGSTPTVIDRAKQRLPYTDLEAGDEVNLFISQGGISGKTLLTVQIVDKPQPEVDKIEDCYETSHDYFERTGMAVKLGHDPETGTFGLAVVNREMIQANAFTVLERDELLRLRDAITRKLAS